MPGPEDDQSERPGFTAPVGPDAVRLQQIARVSAELGAAETLDDVIEAAVDHAARAIGASVTILQLTRHDQLVLIAGAGMQPGMHERWRTSPLDDQNPSGVAARTGRPVVLDSVERIEAEYPLLRNQLRAGRSLIALPLDSARPSVGVIGLMFDGGWTPSPLEMDFLRAYADTCGQAVRRIMASNEARERAERLAFLAQVSGELSSSLDYHVTLTSVANLSVPKLADWVAVDTVQDGVPATVAVAHVDPDKVRWAWALQAKYPSDPDATTGSANVIRTGVSELYADITDAMLVTGARDEEHLRLTRELNLRSALVVPIAGRGRTLGAMTLIRTDAGTAYGPADLALAEEVGRRAAVAIDNAQLYQQTQDVALQLQRALLPDAVDNIPFWEIAAHYAPGGRGGVGGDFYDAIGLPDGGLAFVIGDVMGHGLRAAAAMAQLRASVRAYLSVDPDPAGVMSKLDVMFSRLAITHLATLVYGVADLAAGRLSFVNAGHYPPLLVAPATTPHFVASPPRLPLGAGGDERVATTIEFGGSDLLLLFTDGLVERRGEVIDVGLDRLSAVAPALAAAPLRAGLDDVVGRLDAVAGAEDDVTAFAFRRFAR